MDNAAEFTSVFPRYKWAAPLHTDFFFGKFLSGVFVGMQYSACKRVFLMLVAMGCKDYVNALGS
jgi:hypothetical protein